MKKKFLLCLIGIISSLGLYAQNGSISGKIKDTQTGKFIPSVQVKILGSTLVTSDENGHFNIDRILAGRYLVEFKLANYRTKTIALVVENKIHNNLGVIKLNPSNNTDVNNDIDINSLSADETEMDYSDEGISGMLTSRKDPFNAASAYTFSSARFRKRGYGSEETGIYFNGIPMNNMENGRAYWFLWGGLNDVTRNQISTDGLNPFNQGFGGIGGNVNIDTKADNYGPGTKVTYSMSNKSYTHRVMFKHSTGMMENGWAFTISGSKRWGNEGYTEGTSYDAYGYFLSALKKINNRHSIGLTVLGAPSLRGGNGASVQSAYDIVGSNYYNPNWGWYNGEKRNAKMQKSHQPIAILKHYWDVNDKTKLETSFTYITGESGRTALNWIDAADPRPDYYRNLPIYPSNFSNKEGIAEDFKNNSQLNWDAMYDANQYNNADYIDADGKNHGKTARYFLEDRRKDVDQLIANINLEHKINDNVNINAGATYNNYTGHNFTVVDDLLGADFVMDVDKFASRMNFDFSGKDYTVEERENIIHDLIQSDLNNPDRIVTEGDTYGYNYDSHVDVISAFGQANFSYNKFDYFAALSVSQTTLWREGFMKKGLFPENSYGNSEKLKHLNFGVKAGATYKLSSKNYFSVNAAYLTKAPTFRNSFLSPRTRNTTLKLVDADKSQTIMSGDFSYSHIDQVFKLKVSAYYTKFLDQTQTMGFYHDEIRTFVNSIQTGIDKTHTGAELGLDYKVSPSFTVVAAAAIGLHQYDSKPNLTLVADNSNRIEIQNEPVLASGFKESGYPQQAYTTGIKYSGHGIWAGLNANLYREMYLSYSAIRRTNSVVTKYQNNNNTALYNKIRNQQKLDDQFTLDLSIGKSWNIDYKYRISLNLSVNNLLDNQEFVTGGYEQSRLKSDMLETDISQFPPKLYYAYGRNFFLNLNFRF